MTPRGWLIDTNVVSELRKGPRCSDTVQRWANSVPRTACYFSQVSLAEIRFGIQRAPDPVLRARLETWLHDSVLPWFTGRVLGLDEKVLLRWRWLVWHGKALNYTYAPLDGFIAATALEHDLGVVTRNTADFEQAGLMLLNPWLTADTHRH